MTNVDFSPLIQGILGLIATAIGSLGSLLLYRLTQHYNLKITAEQQAQFDTALNKALVYGAAKATSAISEHGWDSTEVKSQVLATALTQAVTAFPQAVSAVGLSTNLADPKNAEVLTAALERALPGAMAEAAASPATPPTTAPNPETQAEVPTATIHVVAAPAKP